MEVATVEIEKMKTMLEQRCWICPTPKTTKSTFGSVTQPAAALPSSNQPCLKKERVDPSPSTATLDSITCALVPFWRLPSPLLAFDPDVGSVRDSFPSSSAATSVGIGPSSTMDAEPPLHVGIVLYTITSTSNINIIGTTLDSAATELDASA